VDTTDPSNSVVMNEVSMSPTKSSSRRGNGAASPEFKAEAVRLVRTSGKSIGALRFTDVQRRGQCTSNASMYIQAAQEAGCLVPRTVSVKV
jgi:transposase-like protein